MATALRTGETAPQAPLTALKDKGTKTYHHMTPGARFVMPDGLEIRFMGGQFVTNDPGLITELEKVVNKPASQIYTKQEVVASIVATAKAAALDAVQVIPATTSA